MAEPSCTARSPVRSTGRGERRSAAVVGAVRRGGAHGRDLGRPRLTTPCDGRMAAASAARAPARAPGAFDWVLYERAGYFGGKVRTERVDGFVVEGGPDSFIVEKPWPLELARKVGIGDRLLDSNEDVRRSFVFSRGRLHELPEGLILMVPTRLVPFALSSLISLRGKLRMGLDLRAAARPRRARREPRRLRAPPPRRRGARQGRRADRGRHPRRRPRTDERARDVPHVPRHGAASTAA